jgi:hypothetical protein
MFSRHPPDPILHTLGLLRLWVIVIAVPSFRIRLNVLANGCQGIVIAYDVFEVVALPESAWEWFPAVILHASNVQVRGNGFESANDSVKAAHWRASGLRRGRFISFDGLIDPDDAVDVVGHHDKLVGSNVRIGRLKSMPKRIHHFPGRV